MTYLFNIVRREGDPKIIRSGASSLATPDQLGKALGWFSVGLGLFELLSPHRLTRALGMEGQEGLVRAYGAREICSGMLSLSTERKVGLWSRVGGDGIDIVTLLTALRGDNPKKRNVTIALAAVAGITLLDVLAAQRTTARHRRKPSKRGVSGDRNIYRGRSGFPKGLAAARGAAKEFQAPRAVRAKRAAKSDGSSQEQAPPH